MESIDRVEQLLKEFAEQREALTNMVSELEALKSKIDRLFPETLDKRYARFFEEKVKSATELFKAVLDIRKEIIKSLKDEIELRKKFEIRVDSDEDLEKFVDVRSLARKIENINESNNQPNKQDKDKIEEDEMDKLTMEIAKGELHS